MTKKSKKMKLQEKEDRISSLPDSIVQHILSFLPSTREAIKTSLLSKRWQNQWTRVPFLIFYSSVMSAQRFSSFIDETLLLYDCSKIKKFHIQSDGYDAAKDPHFNSKLRFAIRKDVEELILYFFDCEENYRLPEFVFKHASLVKLHTYNCDFVSMPNGNVCWGHLKALNIEDCTLPRKAIQNILCGSPSLESFKLTSNDPDAVDVIASKSLKKLVLNSFYFYVLQISCPNLEELEIIGQFISPSVPKILIDSPTLISTTLNLYYFNNYFDQCSNTGYEIEILRQLQHVKKLKFGRGFIEALSYLKLGPLTPSLLLNNKCLTLESPDFEKHCVGIARALESSYVVEKLVIKLSVQKSQRTTYFPNSSENYWNSDKTVFNCLVSNLKTVEINGLSETDDKHEFVLKFVEFLLKNARVLEKLVVIFKDCGKDFVVKVCQELLNFKKCSQHVMVRLLCSN